MLCCTSADGSFSKPLVIYPGVRPKFNLEGVNADDYDLGCSPNGWISADCFFGWIANLFYPSVRDKVQFPIFIFLDGHSSHINISVAQFCQDHDIILFLLPPHASHILQPLDVAVFGPMKKAWNDSLDAFKRKYKGLSMSRNHFFPVFDACWKKATSVDNVKAGFRKCGLLPWDREAVPYDRIISDVESNVIKVRPNQNISKEEKIGMMRMHQVIHSCIPPNLMSILEKRKEEGYDIHDDTALGTLWKIYISSSKLLQGDDGIKKASNQSMNISQSFNELSASVCDDILSAIDAQYRPTIAGRANCEALGDTVILNIHEPSTPTMVPPYKVQTMSSHKCSTSTDLPISNAIYELPAIDYELSDTITSNIQSVISTSECMNTQSNANIDVLASMSSTVPTVFSVRDTSNQGRSEIAAQSPVDDESSCSHLPSASSSPRVAANSASNDPGPSSRSMAMYEPIPLSPFKNHYGISENVVMNRKVTLNQTKLPFAISGKDYIGHLKDKQEKKKRELDDKEQRKVERERKRKKKPLARQRAEDQSRSEAMVLDDSDDELPELELNTNICQACFGEEEWEVGELWIGCSGFGNKTKTCNSWFHKACLSEDISAMTEDQLRKFELLCDACKLKKRITKK